MSAVEPRLHGARVLDLFAGSGALGLEALSRGAQSVTFVERDGSAVRALWANIDRLDARSQVNVVRADALSYVRRLKSRDPFDLAFADPPYGSGLVEALVELFRAQPFAKWLWIEHNVKEVVPTIEGARTRRYGDTMLTAIGAGE